MTRLIKILADTRITFWCLVSIAALFLVGAELGGRDMGLIGQLNTARLQDWLPKNLAANPGLLWWLPLQLVALLVLAVNTVACAARRLHEILSRRGKGTESLARKLTPTVIHLFFLVIMAGHLLTVVGATWSRGDLAEERKGEGELAVLGLEISSIEHLSYDSGSELAGWSRGTVVLLEDAEGGTHRLAYGAPLRIGGSHVFLDIPRGKKRTAAKGADGGSGSEAEESCNRERDYRKKGSSSAPKGRVGILVVEDPGLYVIFAGFAAMMCLMLWYYFPRVGRRRGKLRVDR